MRQRKHLVLNWAVLLDAMGINCIESSYSCDAVTVPIDSIKSLYKTIAEDLIYRSVLE